MRWRYQPVVVDTEGTVQLCEVHVDDADALVMWSEPDMYPSGDDLQELTADLMRMTVDAYSWRPVLYSSLETGMKFKRAITMEQREALASLTESVAHNCQQAQMARGGGDA